MADEDAYDTHTPTRRSNEINLRTVDITRFPSLDETRFTDREKALLRGRGISKAAAAVLHMDSSGRFNVIDGIDEASRGKLPLHSDFLKNKGYRDNVAWGANGVGGMHRGFLVFGRDRLGPVTFLSADGLHAWRNNPNVNFPALHDELRQRGIDGLIVSASEVGGEMGAPPSIIETGGKFESELKGLISRR
jgi:hypothetical protein